MRFSASRLFTAFRMILLPRDLIPIRGALSTLILLLLLVPAASGIQAAPVAVGDNAIFLTGFQPPNDPNAIDLSGYVEAPFSNQLNFTGGAMTIEAWVKPNANNRNETIVGNGWNTSDRLGFDGSGHIRFTPYGSSGLVDSNGTVPAGVWTHIAVTYDGINRHFYINGVLDTMSNAKPGAIQPAASGNFLGIGFDRDDNFNPNYFGGGIDNVRIWRTVRNVSDISANMFQSFGAPQPNLVAEWSLDGNTTDTAGGNNAVLRRNVQYTNDGAIPHDVRIPQAADSPSLDGRCNDALYNNGTQVTVENAQVFLVHTADHLWICFDLNVVNPDNKEVHVYLDPEYTRVDPAQAEHYRLTVNSSAPVTETHMGAGDNLYTVTNVADGLWDGRYIAFGGDVAQTRQAEFRIDASLVNGWGHLIGLALGKTTGLRGGLRIWPALALSHQPSTWSSAILGGIGPQRTFNGKVVYQPPSSTSVPQADPTGIPGVEIRLIGRDPGGSEAYVALATSKADGTFTVTTNDDFAEHRLELGAPPKGYLVEMASADPPGAVVDPRTVDFGATGGGTYNNTVFTLGDVRPWIIDTTTNAYFLIVAPEAVIASGVMDEYVDFKRRMGFTVEVKSLESIDATMPGANRLLRIRAYEQQIRNARGLLFQYVMLVGAIADIPHGAFYEGFTGYITDEDDNPVKKLNACLGDYLASDSLNGEGVKLKRTDWPYADLTSNFDSNGNGCLLDGNNSKAEDRAPGYTPDTRPTFHAHVAVGRIPFSNPASVETALTNSMRFEQQSEAFKQRTLFAMSQVFLKGQYWTPKDNVGGQYKPCPIADEDKEDTSVNKNCQGATTDAARGSELIRADFLNPMGYSSTIFYESAKPEGASPVQSPQPLTIDNLRAEMQSKTHGFVNFGGHGSTSGVGRTFWSSQNQNGKVDSPTEPLPFMSVNEIAGAELFSKSSFNVLTPDNSRASIYMASACSTLAPTNANNIGATALAQGHGIAWIGAYNMIGARYGWMSPADGTDAATVNYLIAGALFGDHRRLGNAVWSVLFDLANKPGSGSADVSMGLYGDPTLSYWGNPGGQSTLAAWPMLRNDARGIGYTSLAGPNIPSKVWEYAANQPGTAARSPVVSNNGEVIVAHGTFVDVLRQGQLHQRLTLDAPAYGAPAIAADGTVYALDATGRLYAFTYLSYILFPFPLHTIPIAQDAAQDATAALGERQRRWKTDLGGLPKTSPVVGADGYIGVGLTGKVTLVRPDGFLFRQRPVPGNPITDLAMDAERSIFVTTDAGYAARINFFSAIGTSVHELNDPNQPFSSPPLRAYGALYAGRGNQVVKYSLQPLNVLTSFQTNGAITAGPVIGPGGQVLVGTQNGTLYSLTQDLTVRWQRNLGGAPITSIPAFSSDALYLVRGNALMAFNPFSGVPLWTRNLGAGVGDGSVAVGYGRELYLQTTSGKVFGYGEGWSNQVIAVAAQTVKVNVRINGIQVQWFTEVPPIGNGNTAPQVQSAALEAVDAVTGILVQRREGDAPWQDLVILPPGTTIFTDTTVMDNTAYAYRVQILSSDGNHSDFVTTLVDAQSLPGLPGAPTWDTVKTAAADELNLSWTPGTGDVVNAYRIERRSGSDAFALVAIVGSEVLSYTDLDLEAGASYGYRIFASNAAGDSPPSTVVSGTTRSLALDAPQNVTATLLEDGRVRIGWTPGPAGADAVVAYTQDLFDGFALLATTAAADGAVSYYPGEDDGYQFRVKYVQGNVESPWTESNPLALGVGLPTSSIFLPVVENE